MRPRRRELKPGTRWEAEELCVGGMTTTQRVLHYYIATIYRPHLQCSMRSSIDRTSSVDLEVATFCHKCYIVRDETDVRVPIIKTMEVLQRERDTTVIYMVRRLLRLRGSLPAWRIRTGTAVSPSNTPTTKRGVDDVPQLVSKTSYSTSSEMGVSLVTVVPVNHCTWHSAIIHRVSTLLDRP